MSVNVQAISCLEKLFPLRSSSSIEPVKPFLRWAGGKTQLLTTLSSFVPKDYLTRTYHEPFIGAGALFFALRPPHAVLSDANEHLINCYKHVKDSYASVYRQLLGHSNNTSRDYYYEVREKYNNSSFSAAQAARFIYLNKTCFNGIFRVNTQGAFNVPYGWKEPPAIPTLEHLALASFALKGATIRKSDFRDVIKIARRGDFVYLDPPYPPLNGTAYFTHYTADRFGEENQREVAEVAAELDSRGCLVMISNADTRIIRQMYRKFNAASVRVTRFLTCKQKHVVRELIITNYRKEKGL